MSASEHSGDDGADGADSSDREDVAWDPGMATPARPRGAASRQRGQHTAAAIRRRQDSQNGGGGANTARAEKGGLGGVAEHFKVRTVGMNLRLYLTHVEYGCVSHGSQIWAASPALLPPFKLETL